MNIILSPQHFQEVVKGNSAVLIYFSHEQCSVCNVLRPKIRALLKQKFPKIPMYYNDTVAQLEVAAQNRVFAAPTVLVFFESQETFRFSRNIGLTELEESLKRPYSVMF